MWSPVVKQLDAICRKAVSLVLTAPERPSAHAVSACVDRVLLDELADMLEDAGYNIKELRARLKAMKKEGKA